ncbi:MAG: transposase [Candidatus Omnitrophica bacterium]|nr:transposase [Candidatus Omnitrophota bacterium]
MKEVMDLIVEGKIKRYFRARCKPSFEGAITHVTQRAPGKEPLFLEESDYLYMLHLIKEVAKEFKLKVFSFVLMLNHIHLLMKLASSNLSDAMQSLFQKYAMYFNRKYNRKGHVFCGTYRSALCFDESYLLAASLYIHFNPVKAGIVTNPLDYRWSSCALFLSDIAKDSFVDYRYVLGMLNDDISVARPRYTELLGNEELRKIGNVSENPKALEHAVSALKEKLQHLYKDENKKWLTEHGLFGDEDLKQKIKELKEKKWLRNPHGLDARKYMIEQLKARGYSIPDIAAKLNLSRAAIYKALK